jgi:predicted ATP-grasp superfamily ATP-dependent carboligase
MSKQNAEIPDGETERAGPRLRILFTEGSSVSARQALFDLGPRHTIDVLDPSRLCQCRFSKFTRRLYQCPPFSVDPCGYLAFLGERLAAEKYDVLLALHDEVFLLARVREELSRRTAVAIADFPTVAILQSKVKFVELARELGMASPDTQIFTDEHELERWDHYPVFLKLDFGTAGQTVRFVRSRGELEAAMTTFRENGWWSQSDPVLLQKPAQGEQGVVRGIFDRGRLVAGHVTVLKVRGVGGSATVREGLDHPRVMEDFRRLGERLTWHGPLFGEFFLHPATNVPEYIEFNPRIGDSANSFFSGVNLSQYWVDVAMGRAALTPPASQAGVSTHSAMLILMSRAMEGAPRRELWAEIRQRRRREGLYGRSHDELTRPVDDWTSAVPYFWVAGRLLIRPAAAQEMVHRTVKNYALSADAARRIRELPQETLVKCLSKV